jgi:hypothetical protein
VSRLEDFGISKMVQGPTVSLYVRANCVAAVGSGAGGQGSTGLMTERGLSYLVWREGVALLAARGGPEVPATPEQVEEIRKFTEDLKTALGT